MSLRTSRGEHGERAGLVRGEGAGDVHSLSARVDPAGGGALHFAALQLGDGHRAVDARVRGQRDDHASTTSGPSASISAAVSGSRPLSVMTAAMSDRSAKREKWSTPILVWSVSTTLRRAALIMARLAAASDWSGVVSPRSTDNPLVPMKATSTNTSRRELVTHEPTEARVRPRTRPPSR